MCWTSAISHAYILGARRRIPTNQMPITANNEKEIGSYIYRRVYYRDDAVPTTVYDIDRRKDASEYASSPCDFCDDKNSFPENKYTNSRYFPTTAILKTNA